VTRVGDLISYDSLETAVATSISEFAYQVPINFNDALNAVKGYTAVYLHKDLHLDSLDEVEFIMGIEDQINRNLDDYSLQEVVLNELDEVGDMTLQRFTELMNSVEEHR
jgi:acyl carrier protein